jgi:hypothetical protein
MGRRTLRGSLAFSLALGVAVSAAPASARRQTEYQYPFERVWNAALRLVRVDMHLPVTDRDMDAGYLLFDYVDHGRRFPGSFELVKREKNQRPYVTAVVQVGGMPSYIEQMLLDKLERKLKDELGEPMEPPKPAPDKPKEPPKKPPENHDEGGEPPTGNPDDVAGPSDLRARD